MALWFQVFKITILSLFFVPFASYGKCLRRDGSWLSVRETGGKWMPLTEIGGLGGVGRRAR